MVSAAISLEASDKKGKNATEQSTLIKDLITFIIFPESLPSSEVEVQREIYNNELSPEEEHLLRVSYPCQFVHIGYELVICNRLVIFHNQSTLTFSLFCHPENPGEIRALEEKLAASKHRFHEIVRVNDATNSRCSRKKEDWANGG